jgi:hypothetical protein
MCYDIWKLKNKMIIVIFILVLLLVIPTNRYLCATPAERVPLPDPVTVYMTFPAGRSPDSDGNFEVEIYCELNCDIESIEIVIRHSEEIVFNEELPAFSGAMRAGEANFLRINGLIKKNAEFDGKPMPASISINIKYLYPYSGMLEYIKKYIEKRSRNNSRMKQHMKEEYMQRLEKLKGRTMHITKALPVWKPEPVI